MSEKYRAHNPEIKKQVIIELWRETGKQSAGATELGVIQQGLIEHFGAAASESPAAIARVLADHGVALRHPEILEADVRWRQERLTSLFSEEDLNLGTIESATALIEKLERLRREFDGDEVKLEDLRQSVRELKRELELHVSSELAREVAQWLTIWLQNPQIFSQWLDLRRSTPEFRDRFG